MSRIINTQKTLSRYEEMSVLSAIEALSKQDKQARLLLNLLEAPLTIAFDTIRKPLQEILKFRLSSIHFPVIKTCLAKYNINILWIKRQTRKQKINNKVISQDHNHYNGRGNKL